MLSVLALDSKACGVNEPRPACLARLADPGGAPFGGGTLPLRLIFLGGGLDGGGGPRLEGLSILCMYTCASYRIQTNKSPFCPPHSSSLHRDHLFFHRGWQLRKAESLRVYNNSRLSSGGQQGGGGRGGGGQWMGGDAKLTHTIPHTSYIRECDSRVETGGR